jgi:L-ascorbate metabolism protein UlaG (beta-lactamase superfamily)
MPTNKKSTVQKNVKVTWFGHSAFLIESPTGKNILIDPWLDNPKAPAGAKEISHVDLILVTHGHSDHVGNTIEVAKRTNAKVVCIFELSLYFQNNGVERVQGMNKGGSVNVDGINITMTDAKHSGDIDVGGKVIPGGEAAGFVIRLENGYTLYNSGDTSLFGDMKYVAELYKPQAVFLPIGGLFTMSPREAAIACKLLKPKRIVGMHYGTFPALSGTPKELIQYLPAGLKKSVLELVPGTETVLG